ncbi:hypothetical protein GCM10020229_23720 [Kitasatospora albolonga]|uniref:hypothetical protein n=1 Tax=Kitasatospora albolonga TaxID=68173 RepID=UPI0031EA1257
MTSRASKLTRVALAAAITLSGAVATTALATVNATVAQAASSVDGSITRSEVIARADYWFQQGNSISYSWTGAYPDSSGRNYRTDCSGYVSMAWHLGTSLATGTLPGVATQIPRSELKPGDILDYEAKHVILFEKWDDAAHTTFSYYSFGSDPVKHVTGVSINAAKFDSHDNGLYTAYRYDKIVDDNPVTAANNTVRLVDLTPNGDLFNAEGNFVAGNWSPWSNMGAASIKEVASASTGSTNRVFAIGSDNRIWEKDGNYATGQWSGWFQVPNSPTVKAISASSFGNTVHLTAIGTDGQMWNSDGAFPNGGWNGWTSHGGTNLKRIASVSTSDNVNHVFVVDANDQLREIDANYATGTWNDWAPAAGGFTAKDVSASSFGRTVHLTAIGMDGNLYNTDGDFAAGTWNGWSNKGGSGLKRLASATSSVTNVNHVFAVNGSNRLVEIDADYTKGTWSTWAEPAGGADSMGIAASFTS